MKRLVVMSALFSASMSLFAQSLSCQNLGISIKNASEQDCKLRATKLFYGYLYKGAIPVVIPKGTTSNVFFLDQDSTGIGIQIDYRCNDKLVSFYSGQNYCNFYAGDVGGWPYFGNDLGAEYQETIGSYWYSKPGQISWTIY